MATKNITKYRGYTAQNLKDRADIPYQSYMTVSGNDVQCANIDMVNIQNVVDVAINTVAEANLSTFVNRWSGFGPTVRTTTGSGWNVTLVNSAPSPASGLKMSNFAGYNHQALTPGWTEAGQAAATADVWVNSGSIATVISDFVIGEAQYEGADGMVLVAFDEYSGITAYGVEPTSSMTDYASLSADSIEGITLDKTWTLRSYFKTGTISDANDIASAILYRMPNVNDVTVNIKVKTSTYWYYGTTGTQTIPSPWVQNSSAGFNLTTGYFDIGHIQANATYSNIRIYATLFDWTDSVIGTGNIFNSSYSPYDDIFGSVYLGLDPVSNYGYRVVVEFEEDM